MSTRYLIGRAELLTYPIDAPKKKPSDKAHPYTLNEAQKIIVPEIEIANSFFQALPAKACADDLAVARLVLHPAYLAKSFSPKLLLDQVGLASIGSRTRRIEPRRPTRRSGLPAGRRATEPIRRPAKPSFSSRLRFRPRASRSMVRQTRTKLG